MKNKTKLITIVYSACLLIYCVFIEAVAQISTGTAGISISVFQLVITLLLAVCHCILLIKSQSRVSYIIAIAVIISFSLITRHTMWMSYLIILLYAVAYAFVSNKKAKILSLTFCGLVLLFMFTMDHLFTFPGYAAEKTFISEDNRYIVTVTIFEKNSNEYSLEVLQRERDDNINLGILTLTDKPNSIFYKDDYEYLPDINVEWESNDVIIVNENRIPLLH